jgi:sodium transport system permease protein
VREGAVDLVVILPSDYAEGFRLSRPVPVTLVSDSARQSVQPVVERVRQLLQAYSAEIAGLRLIGRGVSPAAVSPLRLEDLDVSSAQQRAARILSFIPLLIVLAAFSGGMQLATDSTAGERERGSLEALLINPVRRVHVAVGKWLAAVVVAMLSVILTTGLVAVVVRLIATEDLGLRFHLGGAETLGILAAVLPMCLLSAALQTCISTLARSFKEAQTYMGLLMLVPLAPGLIGTLYPLGDASWMYGMPLLGTHVLLEGVIGGRPAAVAAFLGSAGISMALAGLLVMATTRLFASERVIFGR